jgi:hypothetical protein
MTTDPKALIAPPVTEEMLQAARDTLPVGFNDLCDADLEDIWEAMHRAALAQPRPEEVEDEAVADGPISREEMIELFGDEMPVEAVRLLWSAPDTTTCRDLRRQLRELAVARPAPKPAGDVLKALRDLLDHVDRETCPHEDTHRGGLIWTVCDACGRKWADDEGGFVPYSDPPAVARARLICEASPAPANAAPASEGEGEGA